MVFRHTIQLCRSDSGTLNHKKRGLNELPKIPFDDHSLLFLCFIRWLLIVVFPGYHRMIIQITATNLINNRLLIAEVETQHPVTRPRNFALLMIRQWHLEKPASRVYQLETVEILEK